jgi:hypothetical protein
VVFPVNWYHLVYIRSNFQDWYLRLAMWILLVLVGVAAATTTEIQCIRSCPDVVATIACQVEEITPMECTLTGCNLKMESCLQYVHVAIPAFEADECPVANVTITVPSTSACAACVIECDAPILRNACTRPDYSETACTEVCTDVQCKVDPSHPHTDKAWRIAVAVLSALAAVFMCLIFLCLIFGLWAGRYNTFNLLRIYRGYRGAKQDEVIYFQPT